MAVGSLSATMPAVSNGTWGTVPNTGCSSSCENSTPFPTYLTNVNGTLYFVGEDNTSPGQQLWKSNETDCGTSIVSFGTATDGTNPSNLTVVNGTLFFAAITDSTGNELFQSISSSTVIVEDIDSGAASSSPTNLTNVNGTLFFTTANGSLWTSKGASTGATLVDALLASSGTLPNGATTANMTNINGTLYFRG